MWPFEALRQKGGRLSWDGWEPRAGMVGYVMHIWRPNHPNKVYRTPLNRDVYLIEIGKNYVSVTANGLRHYNQAMDSNQKDMETSRRNSLQKEMTELRQQQADRGLTPILGSSLESPTSLLADGEHNTSTGNKPKIQAVSSSSSEDESCLLSIQKERHEEYLKNLWQQVIEQDQNIKNEIENKNTTTTTTTTTTIDKETNTNQLTRDSKTIANEIETDEKSNNDKNKTIQNVNKNNNKQTTENETTTAHKDLTTKVLTSMDAGSVCAKELVEQLVDHVVDVLCDTAENETKPLNEQVMERTQIENVRNGDGNEDVVSDIVDIDEPQLNKDEEDVKLIETKFSDNSTDV